MVTFRWIASRARLYDCFRWVGISRQANRRIRQALNSAKVATARQKPQRVRLSILGGVVLSAYGTLPSVYPLATRS